MEIRDGTVDPGPIRGPNTNAAEVARGGPDSRATSAVVFNAQADLSTGRFDAAQALNPPTMSNTLRPACWSRLAAIAER